MRSRSNPLGRSRRLARRERRVTVRRRYSPRARETELAETFGTSQCLLNSPRARTPIATQKHPGDSTRQTALEAPCAPAHCWPFGRERCEDLTEGNSHYSGLDGHVRPNLGKNEQHR